MPSLLSCLLPCKKEIESDPGHTVVPVFVPCATPAEVSEEVSTKEQDFVGRACFLYALF